MAKIRVSELAKEYGMTSPELLEKLKEIKIPAKTASSTLAPAYVSIIKKKLAPLIKERQAQIEEAKKKRKRQSRRPRRRRRRRPRKSVLRPRNAAKLSALRLRRKRTVLP